MNTCIGILILLSACIGNAEWWVIIVNRRHALRFKDRKLKHIRLMHDVGILAFPALVLCVAGFGEGGLLTGGTFASLPPYTQLLVGVATAGLLPFLYSVVRWQLRRSPARLLSAHSTRFDSLKEIPAEDHTTVLGHHISRLQNFPWNEIYHLELSHKQIAVPIGMAANKKPKPPLRIAHFSDSHLIGCPGPGFHQFVFNKLRGLNPDAFVFTGDLLDTMELLDNAVGLFKQLSETAPCYFVLGNHDWLLNHEQIRKGLSAAGWNSVAGESQHVTIAGQQILIAGTELPWIGSNPAVSPRRSGEFRLLLSHSPDQRNYAIQADFDVLLCGHNHGGQVILPIVGPVYSPSIYGVKYAGGLFEYRNLMLHVSRGIGGKDPLRWRCCPEVSLLEFVFTGEAP